jgi:hypothetical protein
MFSFWFPFREMFVICHLFPEIRDEVPENFEATADYADAVDGEKLQGMRFAYPPVLVVLPRAR